MDGILESGAGRVAERIVARGVVVGVIVCLGAVAGVRLATQPRAAADRAYWSVSGPPCPKASQAQLDRIGRPLAQVIVFGGGRFARISGAVVCNEAADSLGLVTGAVCQFNSPRALAVWSRGGSALFRLPGGQPATLTISDDHPPRCVAAAHYDGE